MAEIDLSQFQRWIETRFAGMDERFDKIEQRMMALEDRMTILEHAFVGLAAQIDIRLRDKGATP
jgi:hypothetical protein